MRGDGRFSRFVRAAHARTYASLLRWLGPWTPQDRAPDVRIERIAIGSFEGKLFVPPGRAVGAYAIAPGLHYAGPDDERMDRFCRVLAASGILTLAPYLPSYVSLMLDASAIEDFGAVFDALRAHPACPVAKPGVFSISFGSLLALRLAAARPDDVGAVICFGGYADWSATVRFAVTGVIDGKAWATRDHRNLPVVFMNLLDEIDGRPDDPTALVAAWTKFVRATWGQHEMKEDARWQAIARALADEVPADARELYLQGVGLAPGGPARIDRALDRATSRTAFLDVRPHLGGVRGPVWLVHGLTDDVIPYVQAAALKSAMPPSTPCQVHLTGLYGHTQIEGARSPVAAVKEVATMARIVGAMVAAATRGGGRDA